MPAQIWLKLGIYTPKEVLKISVLSAWFWSSLYLWEQAYAMEVIGLDL